MKLEFILLSSSTFFVLLLYLLINEQYDIFKIVDETEELEQEWRQRIDDSDDGCMMMMMTWSLATLSKEKDTQVVKTFNRTKESWSVCFFLWHKEICCLVPL